MTTIAPVLTKEDVIAKIEHACGIVNGKVDGIHIYYHVSSIAAPGTGASWRYPKPSGRYSIQFTFGVRNKKVYRTKSDGSFDLVDIARQVKYYVDNQKALLNVESIKVGNADIADDIRNSYKGKKFISQYCGSSSYIAPGSVPDTVNVQISYGAVSPETARKILALLEEIEGN